MNSPTKFHTNLLIQSKIFGGHTDGQTNRMVRFQVLTASSMMFRIVFWDVLPRKIIVDNYFTWQYIPEDNSEHQREW
jgi:hypothetical protein